MGVGEPSWWYEPYRSWQANLLLPIGLLYGSVAARRLRAAPTYRSRLPVLCVGNFTAGGTGKTPFSIALSEIVAELGREPWFLSRGYGGRVRGPMRVDPDRHGADEVGDESLLLARHHPTLVSQDRGAGAKAIEDMAPSDAVIIMDDGLQNPVLAKRLSLALVDGSRGFGNGLIIPAGPLRAPLAAQMPSIDGIVLTGGAEPSAPLDALPAAGVPLLRARSIARAPDAFAGLKVIAYAGIANPARFFAMLAKAGAIVIQSRAFADHHDFTEKDAATLLADAAASGATLATTEKDWVRLRRDGVQAELRRASKVLAIRTAFEQDDLQRLKSIVAAAIAHHSS